MSTPAAGRSEPPSRPSVLGVLLAAAVVCLAIATVRTDPTQAQPQPQAPSASSQPLPGAQTAAAASRSEFETVEDGQGGGDAPARGPPRPKAALKVASDEEMNARLAAIAEADPGTHHAVMPDRPQTYVHRLDMHTIVLKGARLNVTEYLPGGAVKNHGDALSYRPDTNQPHLFTVDGFLSEKECDFLVRVHDMLLGKAEAAGHPLVCLPQDSMTEFMGQPVPPEAFAEGTTCLDEAASTRLAQDAGLSWSSSTAMYPNDLKITEQLGSRIKALTGLPDGHGEHYQLVSYPRFSGYKLHNDCRHEQNGRVVDRFATVLLYLTDVEGGETEFQRLGHSIAPRKGRLLVFTSMNSRTGECQDSSAHSANPVLSGRKVIMQRWYHMASTPYLGLRTPPPLTPPRRKEQACVGCDEGRSCRLFNEWTFAFHRGMHPDDVVAQMTLDSQLEFLAKGEEEGEGGDND